MNFQDYGYLFDLKYYPKFGLFGGRTPVPLCVSDNKILLAVGCYEAPQKTAIGLVRLNITSYNKKIDFEFESTAFKYPWIDRGEPGTYSESGIIPSCIIKLKDNSYAFYTIGFDCKNESVFAASSGLILLNQDLSVSKIFKGPILDRGPEDPFWAASPFLVEIDNKFHMLYTSAIDYKNSGKMGKLHHQYVIKSRVSDSHIHFASNSSLIVGSDRVNEYAIARPSVIYFEGVYHLFYCKRETAYSNDYHIFSRSHKDFSMIRTSKEKHVKIENVEDPNFTDCQCYPYPFVLNGKLHLLFNGHQYGKTGFRIAKMKQV